MLDLIAIIALGVFVQQAQLRSPSSIIVGACVTLAIAAAGGPRVFEWASQRDRESSAKDEQ